MSVPETIVVFVPRDAAALAVGADKVAAAIEREAMARGLDVRIVRNGSRGLLWLEVLVEVRTEKGRVAYGPVKASDVPSLFDAGFLTGGEHPLGHGLTHAIPFLKNQTRLTFARCGVTDPLSLDDYRHYQGLKGLANAIAMAPGRDRYPGHRQRVARSRRRGVPNGHQMEDRGGCRCRPEIHRLQCR